MTDTTTTQPLPTTDLRTDRPNLRRRRRTAGVVVFALGAGLGWVGGAWAADPATVAVVPQAVSSPRSADAVERSALPAAVSSSRSADAIERSALAAAARAVSSPRSADAVERSAVSEAEREAGIGEAGCGQRAGGTTAC